MLAGLVLTINSQKRLERIERLKDDPYYIFDKKELEEPMASTSSDIDSIPIVRLDDLMPVAPGVPFWICKDVSTLTSLGAQRQHYLRPFSGKIFNHHYIINESLWLTGRARCPRLSSHLFRIRMNSVNRCHPHRSLCHPSPSITQGTMKSLGQGASIR
jgi:hypothetical protein